MKYQVSVLLVLLGLISGCGHSMCDIPPKETSNISTDHPAANNAELQVMDYGPRVAKAGVAFNKQPDGLSAMWFKLDRSVEGSLINVHVGDQVLKGDISGQMVTVKIPDSIHEKPMAVIISLDKVDGANVLRSNVVTLTLEQP
ncbi:hypothetical protein [Luteibacter anthropi]|uniref:Uncharacterized protein n=1 Tax=Luteibacter anthropi TaxID=564369 RepID=A0A7X5ZK06_9GAMM|nr:hypothetical protein [Luteibacter anthropi]NII08583.1 hypothetical protein [Luteibacter anthropi]